MITVNTLNFIALHGLTYNQEHKILKTITIFIFHNLVIKNHG